MEIPLLARPRSFAAALGTVALAVTLLAQPGDAAASDQPADPTDAIEVVETEAARAVEVLDEATAAFSGIDTGRDLSMTLLELARTRSALPVARRAEARQILSRPTDPPGSGGPGTPEFDLSLNYEAGANPTAACEAGYCVHWARATDDAPDLTDADGNGRPDSVDRVLATLKHVGDTYARAGYRRPVSDGAKGGGGEGLFDVYLVNSGASGVYGYCAPEDVSPSRRSAQAYCALDNDFSTAEFPANTPTNNMQVTVAHEYFHATQFAYDITEDFWFLESTAAWVEDEMFDDVNDNVQYLRASPISQPRIPIDKAKGMRVYGSWIFFRYLSETEPKTKAGLPTIVRDIWRKAAGPTYSTAAIESVLKSRGRSLTTVVAKFADANRNPAKRYDEGRSYPVAAPEDTATVAAGRSLRGTLKLDHLSSGTYRFVPGAGTKTRSAALKVVVDLPSKGRSTAAVVTVREKSGKLRTKLVKVDKTGAGELSVPFSGRSVEHVEVTLVNAGARFHQCGRGTIYSCQGTPRDDNLPLKVRVRATR